MPTDSLTLILKLTSELKLKKDSLTFVQDTIVKKEALIKNLNKQIGDLSDKIPCSWIWILLIAGILGGVTGYFFTKLNSGQPDHSKITFDKNEILQSLLFGLVASLSVPAFLYLVRSKFLDEALTKQSAQFAMFGVALIVAVFGQQFILKMWNIINEMKEMQAKISNSQKDAEASLIEITKAKEVLQNILNNSKNSNK